AWKAENPPHRDGLGCLYIANPCEQLERIPREEHHAAATHLVARVFAALHGQLVQLAAQHLAGVLLVDEQPHLASGDTLNLEVSVVVSLRDPVLIAPCDARVGSGGLRLYLGPAT